MTALRGGGNIRQKLPPGRGVRRHNIHAATQRLPGCQRRAIPALKETSPPPPRQTNLMRRASIHQAEIANPEPHAARGVYRPWPRSATHNLLGCRYRGDSPIGAAKGGHPPAPGAPAPRPPNLPLSWKIWKTFQALFENPDRAEIYIYIYVYISAIYMYILVPEPFQFRTCETNQKMSRREAGIGGERGLAERESEGVAV